jgi:ribosomal protein S27AE
VEKEVRCAWCGEAVSPEVKIIRNEMGEIKERRCPKCNAVLAAYLDEKRTVLGKVRTFTS